jgi:hypothetical protein
MHVGQPAEPTTSTQFRTAGQPLMQLQMMTERQAVQNIAPGPLMAAGLQPPSQAAAPMSSYSSHPPNFFHVCHYFLTFIVKLSEN